MRKTKSEIDVWRIDLDACPCADQFAWLPADDQLRVTRMGTERLRTRMAATRMALRLILSQYLQTPPAKIAISLTPLGYPFLTPQPSVPNTWFNLTHAEGRMMLAVSSEQAVGIDLEYIHRRVEPEKLAPIVLTDNELGWLQSQPDQLVAFLQIWTAKEAALKLWGTGLQIPAKLVSLDWDRGTACVSLDAKYHAGSSCHLSSIETNRDWLAHLATPAPTSDVNLQDFEWLR